MPKVLLTGAAGGIGKATTHLLHQKGYHLILTDYDERLLSQAYPEAHPSWKFHALDVTRLEAWEETLAHFPDIDVLIQLAGIMQVGWFVESPVSDIEKQTAINLMGLAYGCYVYGRHFAKRGEGHIINLASLAGIAPIPGITAYTATKFGVRGLSLALDAELRPRGVAVTVICPGPVGTSMIWNVLHRPESAYAFSMGGVLEPEAVAKAIERAIRKRPKEITLPLYKSIAARIVSLFPVLLSWAEWLMLKGAEQRRRHYWEKVRTSISP
ncbi:MAG: SDR family NAD(P)-dependent oxidoreductase [Bacteroidia bacterium]|nr:SDR family NAD(P)-dependent oxidoreductase [Bacteroidia bacterium]MDW8236628.1 SDR family NAD(P)-dependent oxidoreductase [Bacteroidia bacterium]